MSNQVGEKRRRVSESKQLTHKHELHTQKKRKKNDGSAQLTINNLPIEMKTNILRYLPVSMTPLYSHVCRQWKAILEDVNKDNVNFNVFDFLNSLVKNNLLDLFLKFLRANPTVESITQKRELDWYCLLDLICLYGKTEFLIRLGYTDGKYSYFRKDDIPTCYRLDYKPYEWTQSMLVNAAKSGNFDTFKLVYKNTLYNINKKVIRAAYKGGNTEIITFVTHSRAGRLCPVLDGLAIQSCISGGHRTLAKSLMLDLDIRPYDHYLAKLARNRDLSTLKWLFEDIGGLKMDALVQRDAFLSGDVPTAKFCLNWVKNNDPSALVDENDAISKAMKKCNFPMLEFCHDNGLISYSLDTYITAIRKDGNDVLRLNWIKNHDENSAVNMIRLEIFQLLKTVE